MSRSHAKKLFRIQKIEEFNKATKNKKTLKQQPNWNSAEKIGIQIIEKKRKAFDYTPLTTNELFDELKKRGFKKEDADKYSMKFENKYFNKMLCVGDDPYSIEKRERMELKEKFKRYPSRSHIEKIVGRIKAKTYYNYWATDLSYVIERIEEKNGKIILDLEIERRNAELKGDKKKVEEYDKKIDNQIKTALNHLKKHTKKDFTTQQLKIWEDALISDSRQINKARRD